jgi:beclin 1
VNNYTIKLALNSDAKWTKALKFMLANLKVALQWMVKNRMNNAAAPPQLQGLGHEGPGL